jgi:hypothetical protein
MALLYILTGHKQTDDVMKNLDLNYMSKEKYGEHVGQMQGSPAKHEDINSGDRVIHVLAHGDNHSIAAETGDQFAKRLIDTFGKDELQNRKILVYACNVAEGGNDSALHAVLQGLKQRNVKKTTLVGSVDQTFTMSSGTMQVLKHSNQADALSKAVKGKGGHKRDEAAEPYLRAFRDGWRGYKIRGDGNVENLDAAEAGQEILNFD